MISTPSKNLFAVLSLCLLCVVAGTSAFAGTINYVGPVGDPNGMNGWMDPNGGGTIWYAGVSESNGDPNALRQLTQSFDTAQTKTSR